MNKNENSDLLLEDLSARIPYGLKVKVKSHKGTFNGTLITITTKMNHHISPMRCTLGECWVDETDEALWLDYKLFKPYLRPLSSMTEDEKIQYGELCDEDIRQLTYVQIVHPGLKYKTSCYRSIDWLNSHHFDYRGLIEKDLALEAPKNMYKK